MDTIYKFAHPHACLASALNVHEILGNYVVRTRHKVKKKKKKKKNLAKYGPFSPIVIFVKIRTF